MKKKSIVILMLVIVCMTANAGIYRHDKPKSEYTALAAQPQFDCVGTVYFGGSMQGSCVLVDNKYVLSAAHCFMETMSDMDTIYQGKLRIIVYQPVVRGAGQYFMSFKGRRYRCKAVHVFPDYRSPGGEGRVDIALAELEDAVEDVVPAVINRKYDELHSDIVGVGFGAHGEADHPEKIDTSAEKIAGENVVDSLSGDMINGKRVSMLCDFDHPTKKKCNCMGSGIPRPLEYVAGYRDDGGGAFRKTKNGWELIGICEHRGVYADLLCEDGIGYYGQVMEWQRVSVFADWIREQEK